MADGSRVAEQATRSVSRATFREPTPLPLAAAGRSRGPGSGAVVRRLVGSTPWPICVVTAIAAVLRFSELGGVGGNQFYDAAVRSMSLSWHNFFFGAFDPGAMLSIDKPPLDLWLQVLSVKAFGWSRYALALPEALAGTLAVPLLYDAVRRAVGRPAGLAAATALALLPESVLTARSDTMDSLMMLLVVAALWLTVRSFFSASRRSIVLAGVALGLGFNVKLLEALIAAPALLVLYLLGTRVDPRRKRVDLLLAGGALVAVGLAWAVAVSLAPGRHPWAIGSSDGSVWNAMFVFNGVSRSSVDAFSAKLGGPGPFRLLVPGLWHLDVLFGCVLIAALGLGAAAVARVPFRAARVRGPAVRGRRTPALAEGDGTQPRVARAFAVSLAVWIGLSLVVFDTMGTVHVRYLEALAPALAAVIGYSAASLAGLGPGAVRLRAPSLVGTLAALVAVCAYTFHFKPASLAWASVALILAVAGAGVLVRAGGRLDSGGKWLMLVMILACVMIFPVHESLSLIGSRVSDSLGLPTQPPANVTALSSYLGPRTLGTRYELAVDDPTAVASLIIHDERPILPLTSFGGRPLVGIARLQAAVRSGAVRYGLVSSYSCGSSGPQRAGCAPASLWIRANGVDVTPAVGLTGRARVYLLTSIPQGPVLARRYGRLTGLSHPQRNPRSRRSRAR